MSSKKLGGRWLTLVVLLVLVLFCVIIGIIIWQVVKKSEDDGKTIYFLKNVRIDPKNLAFNLQTPNGVIFLSGELWENSSRKDPIECGKRPGVICLQWNDRKLEIINTNHDQTTECYNITWTMENCVSQIQRDCYEIGSAHWYGGYQDQLQHWPFEGTTRNTSAFVTMDSYVNQIGGVQERYLISTHGIGIYVDGSVPLYISINETQDKRICLISKYEKYPYINTYNRLPVLSYTICKAADVRRVHDYMSLAFFKRPVNIPDTRMFKYPVWSTWAQYHKNINQSIVLQFADDILYYNFSHSQIEIDDDWTPKYGDMDFNLQKFPNPKQMTQKLNEKGFRVTIWVHPFFNIDSEAFKNGSSEGYFIKQYKSELPALVSWWDGDLAGIIDPTNPDAVQWYLGYHRKLQINYNISSFKFDAGEVKWLPNMYSSHQYNLNPNHHSKAWANLAYNSDKYVRHQEVRVSWQTQELPVFVRMLDKFSLWGWPNGLKTLIPCALTFGILGYPFILPDMIGGNAYENRHPDKELFIRWLQASTFMPSIQFSIVPWQYDEEVVNISRKLVELHERHADLIIRLAHESTRSGSPIVRPLWWIAPNDIDAQTVDSEFLLGNDLLVAPVLEQGASSRDIYLPTGVWKDELRGGIKHGGDWIRDYTAELHELPYFTRHIQTL